MIVTRHVQNLIEMYSKRILNRKLTENELRRVVLYNKDRLDFLRNKYYRDINEVIERAIKEIGGDSNEY